MTCCQYLIISPSRLYICITALAKLTKIVSIYTILSVEVPVIKQFKETFFCCLINCKALIAFSTDHFASIIGNIQILFPIIFLQMLKHDLGFAMHEEAIGKEFTRYGALCTLEIIQSGGSFCNSSAANKNYLLAATSLAPNRSGICGSTPFEDFTELECIEEGGPSGTLVPSHKGLQILKAWDKTKTLELGPEANQQSQVYKPW